MTDLAVQARSQQLTLRAAVLRSLIGLWPALDVNRLDATFPAWALAAGQLILSQRATSAGLASQYLRAARFASIGGVPTIITPAPPAAEQLATALRVTSVVAVKRSMTAGATPGVAMRNALVQSSGAASRLVLDAGRNTITESVKADPRAEGWKRITSATPCNFCAMLAGRGAVYKADTVGFEAHDHCGCSAAVIYR